MNPNDNINDNNNDIQSKDDQSNDQLFMTPEKEGSNNLLHMVTNFSNLKDKSQEKQNSNVLEDNSINKKLEFDDELDNTPVLPKHRERDSQQQQKRKDLALQQQKTITLLSKYRSPKNIQNLGNVTYKFFDTKRQITFNGRTPERKMLGAIDHITLDIYQNAPKFIGNLYKLLVDY